MVLYAISIQGILQLPNVSKIIVLFTNMIKCISLVAAITVFISACTDKKEAVATGVRNAHMMSYNSAENYTLLFGGADEKQVLNETWLLKNTSWKKISGDAPPACTFGNLVYDEANNRFILFGGSKVLFGPDTLCNHFLLNDTWEFKNEKWKKLDTKTNPTARAEASMAYDDVRKKIVLFGGYMFSNDGLEYVKLKDTWEFDGTDWNKIVTNGPSPRSGAAMIFNRKKNSCILFGGSIPRNATDSSIFNGITWSWNGSLCKEVKTEAANSYNPAMAYNADENRIVRFGGWDGKQRLNSTWQLAQNEWEEIKTANAPSQQKNTKTTTKNSGTFPVRFANAVLFDSKMEVTNNIVSFLKHNDETESNN
jgi:Galactose oxidase, central domain